MTKRIPITLVLLAMNRRERILFDALGRRITICAFPLGYTDKEVGLFLHVHHDTVRKARMLRGRKKNNRITSVDMDQVNSDTIQAAA